MNSILALLLFGLVLIAFSRLLKTAKEKNSDSVNGVIVKPYISKFPLTPTETIFYHRLVEALPEYVVLAQVQLSSFLKVDQSQIIRKDFYMWFTPISQQSIDFLICRKDFSIITAIELDDKSHLSKSAIDRDTKKDSNLAVAKVPLIRWHAVNMPQIDLIKQEVLRHTQTIYNQMPKEDEWLAGDQDTFFSNSTKQYEAFPASIVFGVILLGLLIWGLSEISSSYKKMISIPSLKTENIINKTQPTNSNNVLITPLERLQQYQAAQAETTKQAYIAKQLMIKQQGEQKLLGIQEDTSKEEMWTRYYKKSAKCETMENIVECGNEYISNRKKFELYWENIQKTRLN